MNTFNRQKTHREAY